MVFHGSQYTVTQRSRVVWGPFQCRGRWNELSIGWSANKQPQQRHLAINRQKIKLIHAGALKYVYSL